MSDDKHLSELESKGVSPVVPELAHKEDAFEGKLEDAIAAEQAEKQMGFWPAIKTYKKAVMWSMAISATLVMEGYDTSLLGNAMALPVFRAKYGYHVSDKVGYQLDPAWQSAVQNAPTIGAFIGILFAGWAQDKFGYRRTLQFALTWIAAAIFVVFFSPNIYVLFVGEFLCGLPWGAFSSSAVAYASDITPVALRGYLTIFVSMCWIIGQFIAGGLLVGIADRPGETPFKLPFAIQWIWPVPLFLLVTFAPESPWWLVRKERYADAEKSVRRLASPNSPIEPAQTVAMMKRTTEIERSQFVESRYVDCFRGVNLRRTEIACVAWAVTIWSGSSFSNHPSYFFVQAGMTTNQAIQMDLGIRGVAFVATGLSWVNLTFFSRRTLFVGGMFGLFCTLVLAGVLGTLTKTHPAAMWGEAAMCVIWVLIWDSMVTTCAYAIVGETSSTRLRAKTTGLARNLYNVSGIVGGTLNTYFMNPVGWNVKGMSAWFWAGTCLCSFTWAYFRLPEMKGRSFRELDILFERGVPARQFKITEVEETEDH